MRNAESLPVKAREWDLIVCGGLNTDYLIRGPRLPRPGETVDGEEFLEAAGGKGGNQAVAAARLGARVGFVGCIGMDARGEALVRSLEAERIETSFVKRTRRASTGAALIMVGENGEKQIQVAPGANHWLLPSDLPAAKRLLAMARVVLLQFEVPMKTVLRMAELAREAGAMVVLDPAPAARMPKRLLKVVDVVRPNATEAQALTGVRVTDCRSARRAARKLLTQGPKLAATQAGEEGDLLVWETGEALFPRLKVKSVDATGAGDAFAAALAVGLAEGRSYVEAGLLANAAAALATTRFGAQPAMPWRAEVIQFLKRLGRRKEAESFERGRKKK
jgi:ribokinase